MSDDIVDRLRCLPVDCDGTCYTCLAADEIVRLRTRVAELEARLIEHGAADICDDFGCICHLCDLAECPCGERNNAEFDRNHNAERALADQLAEAAKSMETAHDSWCPADVNSDDGAPCFFCMALAAYDRARTPATQEPT